MNCALCNGEMYEGTPLVAVHDPNGIAHARCQEGRERSDHLRRYPFECPQCKGAKEIAIGFRGERSCCRGGPMQSSPVAAFAGCEYCPSQVVTQVPTGMKTCDLCNGVGRLEKEPTAVRKTVGWTR